MTKAYPGIQIKDSGHEPEDIGLKGGPVKQDTRSWREKAGKRRTFGSPTGGWPGFDKEGNIVVKRRTDPGPEKEATPKGYAYICFQCASDAGMGDEHNAMMTNLRHGTCDVCGAQHVGRMGVESARYYKLLDDLGMDDGVDVPVGRGVDVAVGSGESVAVGSSVGVELGTADAVATGVAVYSSSGIAVGVAVACGVGSSVFVGLAVGPGGLAVSTGQAAGVGDGSPASAGHSHGQ